MNVISIVGAAVCISVLTLCVKQLRPEIGQVITIGASVVIMGIVVIYATQAISSIKELAAYSAAASEYVEPIIKITGIAYITQLGTELCRDAGENSLAGRVEMAGKVAICAITIPIAKEAFIKIIGIIK